MNIPCNCLSVMPVPLVRAGGVTAPVYRERGGRHLRSDSFPAERGGLPSRAPLAPASGIPGAGAFSFEPVRTDSRPWRSVGESPRLAL